jgi:hypothetical protein
MSFGLNRVILAVVGAIAVTSAAQASEVSITIRTRDNGVPQRIADYNEGPVEYRRYGRHEHRYEVRDPDRFYGRPVPEWREERAYRGGHRHIPVVVRPHWQRPMYAGPHRGLRDSCKIILKERVNRWGELVQVRQEVCY